MSPKNVLILCAERIQEIMARFEGREFEARSENSRDVIEFSNGKKCGEKSFSKFFQIFFSLLKSTFKRSPKERNA
jgi:hypothetical protein